jgi:cytochrome c556
MRARKLAAAGLLLAGSLGLGAAALAQAPAFDPIKTRQDGQLLVLGAFTGMREAVAHKLPVKPYVEPATAIAHWFDQYPSLFPPGSDKGDNTKALPAIWTNFAGFQKDAADASAAAQKLAMLAKADDQAGFAAQLKVLGGACGTCHKSFRAKEH